MQGAYCWDVDGNKYIDYIGSWGPAIVGAADDEVNEVLHAQLEKGTSFGAPCALEVRARSVYIIIVWVWTLQNAARDASAVECWHHEMSVRRWGYYGSLYPGLLPALRESQSHCVRRQRQSKGR